MSDKSEFKKLIKIKGEVRGVVFKTDMEYVLSKKGEEGLAMVEKELKEAGFPVEYRKIESMGFFPVGLRIISLLTIKKLFNFSEEDIEDMGLFATKVSLFVKLFIKYFLSVERVFSKEAPKIWQKHWTIGELVPVKLNREEKYAILKLDNFNVHPLYCLYLQGYFRGILQMLVKSPEIICRETKCVFKGDKHHEFLVKWK